jgi:excisionase family DNA binding protein
MPEQVLMTIYGLCKRCSLRPWTVRKYCAQRRILFVKVGRMVLFRVEDIEKWLAEQMRLVEWPLGIMAPRRSA